MDAKGQDLLGQAFVNYRRGKHDSAIDDKLREEGAKVLETYSPSKRSGNTINVHSIFWIVTSIAVFYYTEFYEALLSDKRIAWQWLYPGGAFLLITFSIGVFCIIWHHMIHGNPDYDKDLPWAVPMATFSFLTGIISSCVGLWPVYSILTPFILFSFFMGFVFFTASLPL